MFYIGAPKNGKAIDYAFPLQFVLHAALDAVEEQQWSTTNMHLGVVDKFHNLQVSGVLAKGEGEGVAIMH